MTTYSGFITITGNLRDNLGDTYVITGGITTTSHMTLLANGTVTSSTDISGSETLTAHFIDGTSATQPEPLSEYAIPGSTSLANFVLLTGPDAGGPGQPYSETDSFNADRSTLTINASEGVQQSFTAYPYGVATTVTMTGSLYFNGVLDAEAVHYSIATPSVQITEGNSGSTQMVYTVVRTGDTSQAGVVAWAIGGNGAHPADGADFASGFNNLGTLSFAAGQTSQTVTFNVAGDTAVEADETFQLQLYAPSSPPELHAPDISSVVATGTIVNDDTMFSLAAVQMTGFEGNGGTPQPFTFSITRSGAVGQSASVAWSVVGFGANPADAADFSGAELPGGVITFTNGQTIETVSLYSAGDDVVEPDETFAVLLSHPSGAATLGTSAIAGIIANDDSNLSIAPLAAVQAEDSATPPSFVVTRSGNLSVAQSASWAVAGSGANPADAADFTGGVLPQGIVAFAVGQTTATLEIPVAADALAEPDEGYTVTLSNPVSGSAYLGLTLGAASADGTILNDDATASVLAITATTPALAEGNAGSTPFVFTISRSGALVGGVTVGWSATAGLANSVNAADFVGGVVPQGTVSFAAGQTSQTITLNVAGDTLAEADEQFRVVLSHPASTVSGTTATIQTGSASATILNDDTSFAVASLTGRHGEGNAGATPFVFAVTRTGDTSGGNAVNWTLLGVAPNSAGPNDFAPGTAFSGTLSFAPGETGQNVTVLVQGDTLLEADEGFRLVLNHATGGAGITTDTAYATILNDDTSFAIVATDAMKPEGNAGSTDFTFTVTRAGNVGGTHSIAWAAVGQGPDSVGPRDFAAGTALSGGLTFLPGETSKTITLAVQGDTLVEPDEHFEVLLRNASAGAAISQNVAFATVLNDDGPAVGADNLAMTDQATPWPWVGHAG